MGLKSIRARLQARGLKATMRFVPAEAKALAATAALSAVKKVVGDTHKARVALAVQLRDRDFGNDAVRNALKLKGFAGDGNHRRFAGKDLSNGIEDRVGELAGRVLAGEFSGDDIVFLLGGFKKFVDAASKGGEAWCLKSFPL